MTVTIAGTNGAAPALIAKPPAMTSTQRSQAKRARDAAAAAAPADAIATVRSVATVALHIRQRVAIGVVLIVTAVLLAIVGMTMTSRYSMATATGADRIIFVALAVAADIVALLMPAAAAALWHARRRFLAAAASILWLMSASVTASNVGGFIAVNADTVISAREVKSVERGLVLGRLERLRAERAAIVEARPAGVITLAIRNATRTTVDDERAALAIAHRRDDIDTQLVALEQTVGTLPSVTMADPAAGTLAVTIRSITGVAITAATLQHVRFVLLLALPLLGGVVLAVGTALIGDRHD
jgi:hypothetical protein